MSPRHLQCNLCLRFLDCLTVLINFGPRPDSRVAGYIVALFDFPWQRNDHKRGQSPEEQWSSG